MNVPFSSIIQLNTMLLSLATQNYVLMKEKRHLVKLVKQLNVVKLLRQKGQGFRMYSSSLIRLLVKTILGCRHLKSLLC